MKKLDEIDTIWEFEELLVELTNKNPALFAPLSLRYQLLLQRHKTFLRVIVIFALAVGFVIGWSLREVV